MQRVAAGGSALAILGLILALGIVSSGARYVIPIAGMIVGQSMSVVLTAGRLVHDAGGRRAQIEATLGLGASQRQCTADVIRCTVSLAMVPVIDGRKTIPIVFLPGAMTGMILLGADPLQGVRLQVAVVFLLLAAVSPTATLVSRPPPGACSRGRCSCGGGMRDADLAIRRRGREALRPPFPGNRIVASSVPSGAQLLPCSGNDGRGGGAGSELQVLHHHGVGA